MTIEKELALYKKLLEALTEVPKDNRSQNWGNYYRELEYLIQQTKEDMWEIKNGHSN